MNTDHQEMLSTPASTAMNYNLFNQSLDATASALDASLFPSEKPFFFAPDLYSKVLDTSASTNTYLQQQDQQLMFFDPLVAIIPPNPTFDAVNTYNSACGPICMPPQFMTPEQIITNASPLSQFDLYCELPSSPRPSSVSHGHSVAVPSSDASTTLSTPSMVQPSAEFDDSHQPPSIEYIDQFIAEHEAKLVEPFCQSTYASPASSVLASANEYSEDKRLSPALPQQQTATINCWSYWTFPNGSSSFPEIITTAPSTDDKTVNAAAVAAATTSLSTDNLKKVNAKDSGVKVTKRRGRGKGVKNKKGNKLANKKLVVAAAAAAAAHMVSSSASSTQSNKDQLAAAAAAAAAAPTTTCHDADAVAMKKETTRPSTKAPKTSSKIPAEGALYVCQHENCGKAFTRPYNLTSHMRTHTTERPYACSSCGRKFARQHDRNRHEKLHWGIRPYACHHCRKTFVRMDALNRHLRMEKGCTVLSGLHV